MINFRDIDQLIERLEKKSPISPGSPPVVVQGELGLWRTVRGFRTLMELQPGTGKWAVDVKGKSHVQGRVLVGPPSLVGHPIADVPDGVWDKLSGSGTKATFPDASPEGIKALRDSVKNALGDDDTRQSVLDATDELPKLVQIARSAGFLDAEVKAALDGKVFGSGLKSSVTPIGAKPKGPKVEPEAPEAPKPSLSAVPDKPKPPLSVVPDKPKAPEAPTSSGGPGKMTADGMFAPLAEVFNLPDSSGVEAKREAANRLAAAAENIGEDFLRKQVTALANGLKTDDYKLSEVKSAVKELIQHRKAALLDRLAEGDEERLADKAAAKDTIAKVKQHVAAHPNPTPEQVLQNAQFYHDALVSLSGRVTNPVVRRELIVLARTIKTRRLGGRSVILRILAILRLLLAFVPG